MFFDIYSPFTVCIIFYPTIIPRLKRVRIIGNRMNSAVYEEVVKIGS